MITNSKTTAAICLSLLSLCFTLSLGCSGGESTAKDNSSSKSPGASNPDSGTSPGPAQLSLSPSSLSDLNITGGSSPGAVVTLTLSNTGEEATAILQSPLFSSSTNFRIKAGSDQCTGASLAADASCSFQIEPTATASTSYLAELTVSDGNLTSNVSYLSGSATGFGGPSLSITPTSLSSLDITGGSSPGGAQTLTLTNNGDATSGTLQAASFSGASPSNFELVSAQDNCTGNTLSSSGTCTFQIRPLASANISYSGFVSVTDGNVTANFAEISGEASGFNVPALSLSPSSLSNLDITGGASPGAAVALTLSNPGTGPTGTLQTPSLSGSGSSNFELVSGQDSCTGTSLAAGSDCTFQIRPVAASDGAYSANLSVGDGSITSNTSSLSGTASGFSAAGLSLTPGSSSSMNIAEGLSPGSPVSFTLTNSGGVASGTLQAPSFAGSNPDNFWVDPQEDNCTGTSLAAGGDCSFTVQPLATADGAFSANLTVSDGSISSNTASLSGSASGFPTTGDSYVFTSSQTYSADFGGLAQADALCQTLADSRGLASPYKAILSSSSMNAKDRVVISGAVKLVDNTTTVANNAAGFWSNSHLADIDKSETNSSPGTGSAVWTGSTVTGEKTADNCDNWNHSSYDFDATVGHYTSNNQSWAEGTVLSCSQLRRLYCLGPQSFRLNLIAKSGSDKGGDIDLSIRLGNDITNYNSIEIRRIAGSSAPDASCASISDTVVTTLTGPFSPKQVIEHLDPTGNPSTKYSYRACIYDSGSNLLTSTAQQGITSYGGHHLIFVTSTVYNGAFGASAGTALSNADSHCATRASAAGLGGTWKAILSNSTTDAKDRFTITHPIYNTNSEKVARDASSFWSPSLSNIPKYNETGGLTTDSIWTGSSNDGTQSSFHCADWTSADSADRGQFGNTSGSLTRWLSDSREGCNTDRRLYCLSDPL